MPPLSLARSVCWKWPRKRQMWNSYLAHHPLIGLLFHLMITRQILHSECSPYSTLPLLTHLQEELGCVQEGHHQSSEQNSNGAEAALMRNRIEKVLRLTVEQGIGKSDHPIRRIIRLLSKQEVCLDICLYFYLACYLPPN